MANNVDILPRFSFLWTGDGHAIQVRSRTPLVNEKGVRGYRLILYPADDLIREYNLYDEIEPTNGFIERWYPQTMVIPLRDDPVKGITMLTRSFALEPTDLSELHEKFRIIIEGQQQDNNALKARLASLHRTHRMAMQNWKQMVVSDSNIMDQVKAIQAQQFKSKEGDVIEKSSFPEPPR